MLRNVVLVIAICWFSGALHAGDRITIGWVETVQILPEGFEIQAKIDTGADNSSLDVSEWNSFNRGGDEWVRFRIYNNGGKSLILERPLERYTRIKRKGAESLERPVVNLWLCLGNKKLLSPVNLSARKTFQYRMLIGRSFLKNGFLVDSSNELTISPACS